MIEEWLATKNADLWADWRISDPDRRKLAADWFQREMNDYFKFASEFHRKRLETFVQEYPTNNERFDSERFDVV